MTPFLVLALIAQVSLPPYLRPDADIERRTVFVEYVYDGDTFRGITADDDGRDASSSRAGQDVPFARGGDTFKGGDGTDYRLAGINAPEVAHPEHNKPEGEPGGEESSDALRRLILGERVTVLIDRANARDRYGRTVGVIMLGDKDINLEMVRSGYAQIRYVDLSPMIDEPLFRQLAQPGATGAAVNIPTETAVAQEAAGHTLGPGDRVRVVVGLQSEDFAVNPDGEILIRGLGVIRIGGMTAANAGTALDSAIQAKGISVSPITVFYLAPPARVQRNVVVLGAVRKSGTYPANTLLGAISAAEGMSYEANPIEVRITLGETTSVVNAARIMGGVERDIEMQGGEVIIVPTLPRILVSGAVAKPNWVTALFLSEAVSAAGGPLPEADLEHAELRDRADTQIRVNVQDIFSGRAEDIRLEDRARVTIPVRPRAIVPNVQVYGPVERPGTQQGFTVADAIREAIPDTRADLTEVIIDRGHGDTTTVNARDIALGHDPDTNLREGDRVLIPRRPEATAGPCDTPTTVTVIGDVKTPGQVPPGTLTQVLANAGGVTNTARTTAIRVRLPDGQSQTYDLARITQGRQDNPALPANATVYIESDEPRRQGMNDLRTFIGIFSTLILLGLKLNPI